MRIRLAMAVLLATTGIAGTAQAQDGALGARVDRLEREMRAVQRKVFPGGAGQTIEPQIVPEADTSIPGTPSGSALADMTQRVSSLEGQLQSLTGQVEQTGYRLRQLEDAFSAYKRTTDARLKALEDTASSVSTVNSESNEVPVSAVVEPPRANPRPPAATTPAPRPTTTATPTPAPAATAPKPGTRAQQVAAVVRPDTGDAAEDGYLYGFRLWSAKLYPEARKELETVATKYPTHRRASFAQNLLGRAYLDAGAPSLAAVAFYENYKKNPNGERAPDSLFYLAKALTQLKKSPTEICKVYTELTQLYGDKISEEMKAGVAEGRATAKCK